MVTDPQHPSQPAAPRRLRTLALVGIDGSGKTTQAHRLATELAARGLPAVYRRNAGGRRWFGRLANLLGRTDAEDLLGRRTVLLIESVLRWLAIARTLLRRAITGEIAVMDRYAVCQYASLRSHAPDRPAALLHPGLLQPGSRPSRAERRARLAYRLFPPPDVTFLLAVDPAVAYDRIESRGYDHETMDYLRAATGAYRALPEYRDFVVIDANRSPDEVAAQIHAHLAAWLPSELLSTGALAAPAGPSPAGPAEPSPAGPSPAGPSPRRDAHPARPRPAYQSPTGTHVRLPV